MNGEDKSGIHGPCQGWQASQLDHERQFRPTRSEELQPVIAIGRHYERMRREKVVSKILLL